MESMQYYSIMLKMIIVVCFFLLLAPSCRSQINQGHQLSPPVKLYVSHKHVEIDNGIVKLTLTKPGGMISGIGYRGIENVLEYRQQETKRGYWDIVWSSSDNGISNFDTLECTGFDIIANNGDQVEVSFTITWNVSRGNNVVPLNIDKRFIVLRGVSGFYSYAIFEHSEGWPDLYIDEARIAFKLNQDLFHYMAISDDKQRFMPTYYDRKAGRVLDYTEAVWITTPRNPKLQGEVDDKYQYSLENKDNRVHGWISSNKYVGFWVITPSDEFRMGGPTKQDLTSHVGPTSLSMFFSLHYAGRDFRLKIHNGEPWKKVFGPVFMYMNSDSVFNTSSLWEDAKRQMVDETKKWPYEFPLSEDFPHRNQRGTISGRLLVRDKYISRKLMPAKLAYVGLAAPGDVGSWQNEAKGYQFWTLTNELGYFTITSVRTGTYNLYAWVPGTIGDYKHDANITMIPGIQVQTGNLVYHPPRQGPTLWDIGIPDRSAAEFYIPDPNPSLTNKLFIDNDEFRQYGLWDRYTDLYPTQDLVYTVGVSDYRKDWFFAHVNRKIGRNKYTATTWRVSFSLRNVTRRGKYTLRLALASANYADIQVRVNNPNPGELHFQTRQIGKDNAIARHGIHGQYWLYNVNIFGSQLIDGENTIYLKQAKGTGPFNGVLYDYIRLEGPPTI